jgi:hypothetical protein
MNFFIMVSLFLSAALGVFRGIDLALLTDAETGLCIVGPVWLRYGALAVAVGAAVAAGRCSQPQAGALRGHCTLSGVVALAAGKNQRVEPWRGGFLPCHEPVKSEGLKQGKVAAGEQGAQVVLFDGFLAVPIGLV